ncbi:hypothetical protein TIFTF001_038723 [Ficus carica]|uniref:Uncharacterized protein n=1 Tax=Ficus carica TaxID=3494 RepID=A0AA88EC05_FICCA|nr:hypothetical protein TIFTF001_038723 [Ficus carica]
MNESSVIWLELGRKWPKLATSEIRHSDVNAHAHDEWSIEQNERARRDHKRPLSPPKYALGISLSELIAHLKCQDFVTWPKKLPENPARDTTKYYEFHKDHGHQTIDCRALRAEVIELLKKGHL